MFRGTMSASPRMMVWPRSAVRCWSCRQRPFVSACTITFQRHSEIGRTLRAKKNCAHVERTAVLTKREIPMRPTSRRLPSPQNKLNLPRNNCRSRNLDMQQTRSRHYQQSGKHLLARPWRFPEQFRGFRALRDEFREQRDIGAGFAHLKRIRTVRIAGKRVAPDCGARFHRHLILVGVERRDELGLRVVRNAPGFGAVGAESSQGVVLLDGQRAEGQVAALEGFQTEAVENGVRQGAHDLASFETAAWTGSNFLTAELLSMRRALIPTVPISQLRLWGAPMEHGTQQNSE